MSYFICHYNHVKNLIRLLLFSVITNDQAQRIVRKFQYNKRKSNGTRILTFLIYVFEQFNQQNVDLNNRGLRLLLKKIQRSLFRNLPWIRGFIFAIQINSSLMKRNILYSKVRLFFNRIAILM